MTFLQSSIMYKLTDIDVSNSRRILFLCKASTIHENKKNYSNPDRDDIYTYEKKVEWI